MFQGLRQPTRANLTKKSKLIQCIRELIEINALSVGLAKCKTSGKTQWRPARKALRPAPAFADYLQQNQALSHYTVKWRCSCDVLPKTNDIAGASHGNLGNI